MSYTYLDLYKLHIFLRAAQSGSFSAAAAQLFISQPAVSQHIRDLEAQLGVTLFRRGKRGVQLTPHGEQLRDYAERLLALASEAQRNIANLDEINGEVQLAVGATPGIGHDLLPTWLLRFHEQHPHVKVSIHSGTTQAIAQLLRHGRVEVGVIEGELGPGVTGLAAQVLGEVPQHLVVGPKHRFWSRTTPVALHELDGEAFITRQPNSQTRAWMEALFAQHHIRPHIVAEFDNPAAIKRLVEQSAALTLLPEYVIAGELHSGQLRAVPVQPPLTRTLRMAWVETEPLSLQAEAFVQFIAEAAQSAWAASPPACDTSPS